MTDTRTWLASVLFLDIVGYTKVSVDQQMAIKLHLMISLRHNKVHEVFELVSPHSPENKPSIDQSSLKIDSNVKERILKEYANLAGSELAETQIQAGLKAPSSQYEPCQYLAWTLNEDNRYHFNEFARYYGYSSQ